MCVEHAAAIDESATLAIYSAAILKEWKSFQFTEYDRLKQGWGLDDSMAENALASSFTDVGVLIQNSTLKLGGAGGNSPGAGGGGGGAVGPGARGGDGGGGGDVYSATISLTEAGQVSVEQLKIEIGKGGSAGHLPGQHAEPGEDTRVSFVSKNGTILHEIRAKGGQGARSGASYLPDGVTEISEDDIAKKFRVTTFMTVNNVEFRDGLSFILGGDWHRWVVPSFPCDIVWCVMGTAVWSTPLSSLPKGIYVSLNHPDGQEVACVSVVIPDEAAQEKSFKWYNLLGASFDREGVWFLKVLSGGYLLSELGIRVTMQP